jgi:hypothetical protein
MGGGGMYDYKDNMTSIHQKSKKGLSSFEKGVASHELGHSKNVADLKRKKLLKPYIAARQGGQMLTGAAGQIAKNTPNTRVGKNINKGVAAAATAGNSVTLAEEAAATIRGVKGIAKTHGGGVKGYGKTLTEGKGGVSRAAAISLSSYGMNAAKPVSDYLKRAK